MYIIVTTQSTSLNSSPLQDTNTPLETSLLQLENFNGT